MSSESSAYRSESSSVPTLRSGEDQLNIPSQRWRGRYPINVSTTSKLVGLRDNRNHFRFLDTEIGNVVVPARGRTQPLISAIISLRHISRCVVVKVPEPVFSQ